MKNLQLGAVRKMDVGGGQIIWEKLVAISDLEKYYTYHILPYGSGDRPLDACAFPTPPINYYATVRAKPVTANGTVVFRCSRTGSRW